MIMHQRPQSSRRAAQHGFTLPELLIALTIFVTLMGGIVLLFNSAIRTVRQGYQSAEAFELARGALGVIEADLSRAFISREHGDYYHFYGTPIGFTFVGLVEGADIDGTIHNIARVSYVIYATQPPPAPAFTDTVKIFASVGEIDPITGEPLAIATYSLLRFIEPGQEDLDSFPVDWENQALAPGNEVGATLATLIRDQLDQALSDDSFFSPGAFQWNDPNMPDRFLQVVNSAKRQLWIRMLAGGDVEAPSIWGANPLFFDPVLNLRLRDPEDFIVAENIRFIPKSTLDSTTPPSIRPDTLDAQFSPFLRYTGGDTDDDTDDDTGGEPFFLYGRTAFLADATSPTFTTSGLEFREYWNEYTENAVLLNPPGADFEHTVRLDRVGTPLIPRIPEAVDVKFRITMASPFPGAPDFDRTFKKTIDIPTAFARVVSGTPDLVSTAGP